MRKHIIYRERAMKNALALVTLRDTCYVYSIDNVMYLCGTTISGRGIGVALEGLAELETDLQGLCKFADLCEFENQSFLNGRKEDLTEEEGEYVHTVFNDLLFSFYVRGRMTFVLFKNNDEGEWWNRSKTFAEDIEKSLGIKIK